MVKELIQSMGKDAAMGMSWDEFEMLTMEEFYPESVSTTERGSRPGHRER
jgi:hypothetical protein